MENRIESLYRKNTTSHNEKELNKEKQKSKYKQAMRETICVLLIIAATACIIANTWISVVKVYGNSMEPTINGGDVIVSARTNNLERGDIITLYNNNKLVIRRIIGKPGDWVDIDENGFVTVNGQQLDEPYIYGADSSEYDIELPVQISDNKYFVMGDNRITSIDSRDDDFGLVDKTEISGKVVLRIYPFKHFEIFFN